MDGVLSAHLAGVPAFVFTVPWDLTLIDVSEVSGRLLACL
jgi:hypothetical protein